MQNSFRLQLLAWLSTLITVTSAGQLTVMQPSSLVENIDIQASLGNFGHITYGQQILGKVILAEGENRYGCNPLSWADFPTVYSSASQVEDKPEVGLFVLVERGQCSNPTKIRNIETFGGAIGLIADYMVEDEADIVMVDYGGAGHSLVTPGFMIDYISALQLKDALTAGTNVIMRASLTISKPDNEVEIGVLLSSSLDLDAASMQSFTKLALESAKTRQKALLDFHIHTFACPSCPDQVLEQNCVSYGDHCAFFPKVGDFMQEMLDPEDYEMDNQPKDQAQLADKSSDFTGRDLILTTLNEKCYHEVLKKIIESGRQDDYSLEQTFITQMITRLTTCEKQFAQTGIFQKSCLFSYENEVPQGLKQKVKQCFDSSWERFDDYESVNSILLKDQQWAFEHHLTFHPAITINDFTYRGDIEFADIREAICAAYQERPSHCNLEEIWNKESTQRPYEADEMTVEDERKVNPVRAWHVILSILFILVVQFFLWLYLQRRTRIESSDQVNQRISAAIHEYFALSAEDDF